MKFGTLLELNSNVEWFEKYVDYDALKKLFPSEPFDTHRFPSTSDPEASPLLDGDASASSEEFLAALERERTKVVDFYAEKEKELGDELSRLKTEVRTLEDRELDDVAEEDEGNGTPFLDEDEIERLGEEGDVFRGAPPTDSSFAGTGLRPPQSPYGATSPTAPMRRQPSADRSSAHHPSPLKGKGGSGGLLSGLRAHFSTDASRDEADLLEAQQLALKRSRSRSLARSHNRSASGRFSDASPTRSTPGKAITPGGKARQADGSEEYFTHKRTHRLSMSSASTDGGLPTRGNLGLIPMGTTGLTDSMLDEGGPGGPMGDFVWTANTDYGKVLRIGFKKRIAQCWLEGYALRQYAELNMTAFEKILKKYDKNTNSDLKKRYIKNTVLTSHPWTDEAKAKLDELTDQTLYLYARVAAGGDIELAKQQLRAQLREKIVIDRETVWSKMIHERRQQDAGLKVVAADEHHSVFEKPSSVIRTPMGTLRIPSWLSAKPMIFVFAILVLVGIMQAEPFERVEETNCLAMLVFCTILWATEAIPLFVTSFCVPFLVVTLRLIRSTDGKDRRLSAPDATKYIFSQIFSPTIMLLIGGFTIAAVLSKTRLDVMTATRVLNAAGSNPSVVLLVLMLVATFASMWISNVAAPTLCYALIKPITDELAPKSTFSRCLILAIALASNIGGQASPISSPQNLISLGAMDPPLSWLQWFAISLPVASISIVAIWGCLHIGYRWEHDLQIPRMRKNSDPLTRTHYYVLFVTLFTIALWCGEKSMEAWVGDMGIIAIIPIVAFFGTGILSKEDFHHFHWSIVFLAMGGISLGKAVLSSGLLDDLDAVLEKTVEGMGLYKILIVFSSIALVIATFISHTIAAVLLVPIAERIGNSLEDPHPRLLIMATALICSAGMGLPVSGFPNMTAITQENKLGQRYIGASDFLKNGIPASIVATVVIVTVGYTISTAIGL